MKLNEADLPAVRAKLPELTRMNLEHLGSNRNTAISIGAMGLEATYRIQGVVSFLTGGSADGFYHGMFLAAAVRRWFLRCVRRGMRVKRAYLLLSYDAGIYEALCSADPRILLDLAKDKLTLESHPRFDDGYHPFFSLALRLLCMGHRDEARRPLGAFDKNREDEMEGPSKIAHGILDSDEALFNDGLAEMLAERKAQIDEDIDVNVGEQWISVEGLGLARLGLSSGLAVTARHPLLPPELLERPRSPYPDPDAILPPVPETFLDSLKSEEAE